MAAVRSRAVSLPFRTRNEYWAYRGGPNAPGRRTVDVYRRLAAEVERTVAHIDYARERPKLALEAALNLLSGDELEELSARADVDRTTRERRIRVLESVYGLEDFGERRHHRPGRALLLLAAEAKFVPLVEGLAAAIEWSPTSTRLELRSAFHLVSRWWAQNEPKALSRLAICSLATLGGDPLPWAPATRMYAGVLHWHRPADHVDQEADALSKATVAILFNAYRKESSKREIMQELFESAEAIGVLERRAGFDLEPELQRRHELTRLLLDLEVGREFDQPTADLPAVRSRRLVPRRRALRRNRSRGT